MGEGSSGGAVSKTVERSEVVIRSTAADYYYP